MKVQHCVLQNYWKDKDNLNPTMCHYAILTAAEKYSCYVMKLFYLDHFLSYYFISINCYLLS